MDPYSFLNAAHTSFFADLYDKYLQNPDSVEPSWRAFFQGYDFGSQQHTEETVLVPTSMAASSQMPESMQKDSKWLGSLTDIEAEGTFLQKQIL